MLGVISKELSNGTDKTPKKKSVSKIPRNLGQDKTYTLATPVLATSKPTGRDISTQVSIFRNLKTPHTSSTTSTPGRRRNKFLP
jgi:hypothetical protein